MDENVESRRDLEEIFDVLLPDTPMTDVLQRVVTLACRTVGHGNSSVGGITVVERSKPMTPVYTDERSPRVDQVQGPLEQPRPRQVDVEPPDPWVGAEPPLLPTGQPPGGHHRVLHRLLGEPDVAEEADER